MRAFLLFALVCSAAAMKSHPAPRDYTISYRITYTWLERDYQVIYEWSPARQAGWSFPDGK